MKLFQNIALEGTLPNSFYEAIIPRCQNQTKTSQKKKKKKKLQASNTDEHRCKNLQQKASKPNPTIYLKDCTPQSSGIHPRDAGIFQYMQINQCDTPR